jgi:hypothetical protein
MVLARLVRPTLICVVALAVGAPVWGQMPDASQADRALERALQRLRADPTLPDSLRRLTTWELSGLTNTSHLDLMDDAESIRFVDLLARTLRQMPDSACVALFQRVQAEPSDIGPVLAYVDSVTAGDWAALFERLVQLRARRTSRSQVAGPEQVQATLLGLLGQLAAADRERVLAISAAASPNLRDWCWLSRAMMDRFARLPPAEVGPVARAMAGAQPPR